MRSRQSNRSALLFGSNPYGAGATHQGKRILSDNFGRPLDFQLDSAGRERLDGIKLIGHAQDDASGIGAIADQARVIGQQHELLIDAFAGVALRDYLLSANVSLNAQVSPLMEELAHFDHKRGIAEVRELLPIRVYVRDQFIGNVELEMVAIRANDRLGKADGGIAARPMKRGFEDDLVGGIALRLVETGGGFRLAKHVRDAVVADAVAGAEIAVRVVVEGAPSNAARIL